MTHGLLGSVGLFLGDQTLVPEGGCCCARVAPKVKGHRQPSLGSNSLEPALGSSADLLHIEERGGRRGRSHLTWGPSRTPISLGSPVLLGAPWPLAW